MSSPSTVRPILDQISDTESSITLSMYLGVKWEDSRIFNTNISMEDLQGVGFPFLSYLWQPDIEIHHIRKVLDLEILSLARNKKEFIF